MDLGYSKIDHFDPVNKIIREVKKSSKLEHVHIAQVKYYLYSLEQRGINGASGLIEYPKQRKTKEVALTDEDREMIKNWLVAIEQIVTRSKCPDLEEKNYCRSCAFRDFCFV